eukprot:gene31875-7084_t
MARGPAGDMPQPDRHSPPPTFPLVGTRGNRGNPGDFKSPWTTAQGNCSRMDSTPLDSTGCTACLLQLVRNCSFNQLFAYTFLCLLSSVFAKKLLVYTVPLIAALSTKLPQIAALVSPGGYRQEQAQGLCPSPADQDAAQDAILRLWPTGSCESTIRNKGANSNGAGADAADVQNVDIVGRIRKPEGLGKREVALLLLEDPACRLRVSLVEALVRARLPQEGPAPVEVDLQALLKDTLTARYLSFEYVGDTGRPYTMLRLNIAALLAGASELPPSALSAQETTVRSASSDLVNSETMSTASSTTEALSIASAPSCPVALATAMETSVSQSIPHPMGSIDKCITNLSLESGGDATRPGLTLSLTQAQGAGPLLPALTSETLQATAVKLPSLPLELPPHSNDELSSLPLEFEAPPHSNDGDNGDLDFHMAPWSGPSSSSFCGRSTVDVLESSKPAQLGSAGEDFPLANTCDATDGKLLDFSSLQNDSTRKASSPIKCQPRQPPLDSVCPDPIIKCSGEAHAPFPSMSLGSSTHTATASPPFLSHAQINATHHSLGASLDQRHTPFPTTSSSVAHHTLTSVPSSLQDHQPPLGLFGIWSNRTKESSSAPGTHAHTAFTAPQVSGCDTGLFQSSCLELPLSAGAANFGNMAKQYGFGVSKPTIVTPAMDKAHANQDMDLEMDSALEAIIAFDAAPGSQNGSIPQPGFSATSATAPVPVPSRQNCAQTRPSDGGGTGLPHLTPGESSMSGWSFDALKATLNANSAPTQSCVRPSHGTAPVPAPNNAAPPLDMASLMNGWSLAALQEALTASSMGPPMDAAASFMTAVASMAAVNGQNMGGNAFRPPYSGMPPLFPQMMTGHDNSMASSLSPVILHEIINLVQHIPGLKQKSAFITMSFQNFRPFMLGGGLPTGASNTNRACSASTSKVLSQKLPHKVYVRLEEIVNRGSFIDWKHFDAGVVKVMSQLSDIGEADMLEELDMLDSADLSNVEYMPAYLNKRLNNRLWSRRKAMNA